MNLPTPAQHQFARVSESQRLKLLLTDETRNRVLITEQHQVDQPLIQIYRDGSERLEIRINSNLCQKLQQPERDLLFLHHVARIDLDTIPGSKWDSAVLKGSLLLSVVELLSQNLLVFAIALIIVGLSAHQLYQKSRGEHALKDATTADQRAISIAIQFGYSFGEAHCALKGALKYLASHVVNPRQRDHYQARLKVLDICSENRRQPNSDQENSGVLRFDQSSLPV